MRKKNFLLFEILIALSLIGMLLSLLFSFLVQTTKMAQKIETVQEAILERQYMQIQLQDLFLSLRRRDLFSPLYTSKESEELNSLFFLFDHGIDPDPLFSGILPGKIYIDAADHLCFSYWPSSETKSSAWRTEVLCSKVQSVQFSFLHIKDSGHTIWMDQWPKTMKTTPSMIRMTLHRKETTLTFCFQLPNTRTIPTYKERT